MKYKISDNIKRIALEIKGYPKKLISKVDRAANTFMNRYVAEARKEAPEAEGTLKNSIRAKKLGVMDYEAGTNQNYAGFVEGGTGPGGVAPLQSLIDWLKVRRIRPHNEKWDRKDLAFAIQQKIKKDGTNPQPFSRTSLNRTLPMLDLLIKQKISGA